MPIGDDADLFQCNQSLPNHFVQIEQERGDPLFLRAFSNRRLTWSRQTGMFWSFASRGA
jgi:hypothetical protein